VRRLLKWLLGTAAAIVLVVVTVIFVRAFDARRLPDLKPWHRSLRADIHARDLPASATLADYLRREDAVFRELTDRVLPAVAPKDRTRINRYAPDSPVNPLNFPKNWNRTFEIVPDGPIRGGVLLVHGLTDAPYSVKAEAEIYASAGFYALCLRMPGHGTVPGALTDVRWQDWRAAARLGARHVRSRIGPGLPFHFAGYSNGGALAVQYALDCLEDASLPKPDRVVLFSPMIGVVRYTGVAAAFAKLVVAVGTIPYFAKSRWLDIQPEYNPFKYNSFPAFAGQQTAELTGIIQDAIAKEVASGRIREMPPILAFSSLVDATVETWATVDLLFGRLPDNGSELVLYDVNRSAVEVGFLKNDFDARLAALRTDEGRRYRLTLVTNARAGEPEAVARSFAPGSTEAVETPLGLSWPPLVFSLSHLAVPFRFDDPLFGIEPDRSVDYGLRLGTLAPRGEKGVLTVPMDQLMRINCNPFFPYEEARIRDWIAAPR
jgi:alpha-beta hydrolase superfamily lysophospholipase